MNPNWRLVTQRGVRTGRWWRGGSSGDGEAELSVYFLPFLASAPNGARVVRQSPSAVAGLLLEPNRPGACLLQCVVRVQEGARLHGKASAADTAGEFVFEVLEYLALAL